MNDECPIEPLSPNGVLNWDGVSKLNGTPKNDHVNFLRLDIKTHRIKFSLKVFICRQYNEKGPYDVCHLQ